MNVQQLRLSPVDLATKGGRVGSRTAAGRQQSHKAQRAAITAVKHCSLDLQQRDVALRAVLRKQRARQRARIARDASALTVHGLVEAPSYRTLVRNHLGGTPQQAGVARELL